MPRQPHTITPADFEGQTIRHEIAGSYGNDSMKSLTLCVTLPAGTIRYTVLNHGKLSAVSSDLQAAVNSYNALP